jgi:hypothetical protein
MDWISISDSSAIEGFGYDTARRTLEVRFKSGQAYTYFNVPPKVFDAMQDAPSKGHFVTDHVKGKFEFLDKRDVGRPKRSLIRDQVEKRPRFFRRDR